MGTIGQWEAIQFVVVRFGPLNSQRSHFSVSKFWNLIFVPLLQGKVGSLP